MGSTSGRPILLEVQNLSIDYVAENQPPARAVEDGSFVLHEGESMGLVGESGCGKTTLVLALLRLLPAAGQIVGGRIRFMDSDVTAMNDEQLMDLRWKGISIIFQGAMNALNPVRTVGDQIREAIVKHVAIMPGDRLDDRVVELLELAGIAADHKDHYPHQYSGGMRQRAMIAMALACTPQVVIADEPTTALDVTIQAQLLELMKQVVEDTKTSLVLVTHNLGIVARYVNRLYIMYAGRIVESGSCEDIFRRPLHPYTLGLFKSVPRLDEEKGRKLVPIQGSPPSLVNLPATCAFLPRCTYTIDKCFKEPWPALEEVGPKHCVRCYVTPEEKA